MRPIFRQLDQDLAEQIIAEAKIVLADIGVDKGVRGRNIRGV